MRMLGLLLLGGVIGALAMWAYQGGNGERNPAPGGPANGAVADKRSVFAIGTLEPRGGPVLVTSPLVGTQIREVLVREGQIVEPGMALINLDTTVAEEELRIAHSQRTMALEKQQTDVALARQRAEASSLALEQARSAHQVEMESQQKHLDVSQAKLEQSDSDLRRLQTLQKGERPLGSAQQVEQQRTAVKLAKAEREAASAAVDR